MGRAVAVRSAPSLERARELFREAQFTRAAELLDRAEAGGPLDAASAILRARIRLVRDPAGALIYLTERARSLTSKPVRGEATVLQGAALARLGDHASAAACFRTALALCAKDPSLSATVRYQQATSLWMQRKLDEAQRILSRVDWSVATDQVRVQHYVLRGAIEASRGNMAEQGGILLEALRFVREEREPSVLHWAYLVSQISYLARELYSPSLRAAAYEELPKVPWTTDIADTHFTTLRAVAWCHALEGDYFNAFRRLKEAALVAPSPAWRVMSLCDRSYLARCLGETRWAEQERSDARELATTVDWNALDGEERFALCLLAELFAETDGPLALAQIAEYRKATRQFSSILASADDRRVTALESYSLGVVQQSLGETAEAIRLVTQAYQIYDAVGYRWRSGRAARVLAQLTGQPVWRERAASALDAYPRSWLMEARAKPHVPILPGVASLTASQQAVYEHLVRGLSTREIALQLQRSEFTIRNHVKAIFKALGVKSRASLIARATGTQEKTT
jgi:DNA-binding NarL/FixJ family response regulator